MKTVRLLLIAGCCFFYSSIAAASLMDGAIEKDSYASNSMWQGSWRDNLGHIGFTLEQKGERQRFYIGEEDMERLVRTLLSKYMGESERAWEGAYCDDEVYDEGDMQSDASVPEPGALTLLSIGLLGLGMVRVRKTH